MNSQQINFKYINHRILLLKSYAFRKIIFTVDQSDTQSLYNSKTSSICSQHRSRDNADPFLQALNKILSQESLRRAFDRIKLAAWKIILQVKQDEQEDSIQNSTLKSQSQLKQNIPFNNQIKEQRIKQPFCYKERCNRGYVFDEDAKKNWQCYSKINSQTTRLQQKQSNFSYSRIKALEMKRKKRQIIINKIHNIQICVQYITSKVINNYQNKKQQYIRYQ